MSPPSPKRRGMTLIEVVVALTITATLLLTARRLTDGAAHLIRSQDEWIRSRTATINGEWQLRELVRDARAGSESGAQFRGDASTLTWDSWCRVPRGWKERCRLTLAVRAASAGDSSVLIVVPPEGAEYEVARRERTIRLAYLDDPAFGGRWVATWGPGTARPIAVGVLSRADTLLLPTGTVRR